MRVLQSPAGRLRVPNVVLSRRHELVARPPEEGSANHPDEVLSHAHGQLETSPAGSLHLQLQRRGAEPDFGTSLILDVLYVSAASSNDHALESE